jgi:hypothetical protein
MPSATGAERNSELMQSLNHTAGFGCLMRARDGEVGIGSDGLPTPSWELSEFDRANMRKAMDGAAQILEAAGARRICPSHAGSAMSVGAARCAATSCGRSRPSARSDAGTRAGLRTSSCCKACAAERGV